MNEITVSAFVFFLLFHPLQSFYLHQSDPSLGVTSHSLGVTHGNNLMCITLPFLSTHIITYEICIFVYMNVYAYICIYGGLLLKSVLYYALFFKFNNV